MHRYRDTIVLPDPTKRGKYRAGIVRGAIVLFPYPDEAAYRAHKFYESLASVDIGRLPFLPTVTTLVEEKLCEVLASNGFWDQPRGEALGDEAISATRANPHNGGGGCARKRPKRGRKQGFNAAIHALRDRVERTFAWEDKFRRVLLRFEHIQQRHYGMKLMAYTLINVRRFCAT